VEHAITIVGVVADARLKGPEREVFPEMFWPIAQYSDANVNVFLRTTTAPLTLAAAARREIGRLDPNVPVVNPRLMARVFDDSMWRPRMASVLFGAFALLALMLSALGLYGVLSYSVSRRRREIGIRLALGDRPGGVMRSIALEGFRLAVAGVGFGLAVAFLAAPALRTLLPRDPLLDPVVIGPAAAILMIVAVAASLAPARRAAHVDPAHALRSD
jgi:ABC-type antimicrobial peptide transport system permease subunit